MNCKIPTNVGRAVHSLWFGVCPNRCLKAGDNTSIGVQLMDDITHHHSMHGKATALYTP